MSAETHAIQDLVPSKRDTASGGKAAAQRLSFKAFYVNYSTEKSGLDFGRRLEFLTSPNSPTLQSILNQIRQASDIMKDGTQDPNAVCDAISIELGFDMRSVQLGPIAPFAPPLPDPCAP